MYLFYEKNFYLSRKKCEKRRIWEATRYGEEFENVSFLYNYIISDENFVKILGQNIN